MTTVRQIERAWTAKTYEKLFRELVAHRPEATFHFDFEAGRSLPAAAMAVIRLEELNQSHVALCAKLVRAILAGQEADGGWGDVVTTTLCLRALFCSQGNGTATELGLAYLLNLQKDEGIWPSIPIRRMAADAYVSAFVLQQLGDILAFRQAVRFEDAVAWFETHAATLDTASRRLWDRAAGRCRRAVVQTPRVSDAELFALCS